MGNDRQTEPELKRCGPTRVRDRCINASVTCDPRQNKKQWPYMHFEVRALDRLRVRTRRRVGSTRRRGNHMHDHSRFQRDINDVTGVSHMQFFGGFQHPIRSSFLQKTREEQLQDVDPASRSRSVALRVDVDRNT